MNFKLLPQKDAYIMYAMYDINTGYRLTDDLEIPKTKIRSVKEMRRLDRWSAYFSNKLNEKEMEELALSETVIREALQAESIFMQDDIERRKYEQREKAIRDYLSAMRSAKEEGKK